LAAVGGLPWLSELHDVLAAENVEHHAAIVEREGCRRLALQALSEAAAVAAGPDAEPQNLLRITRELVQQLERSAGVVKEEAPAPPTAEAVLRSVAFSRAQQTYPTGLGTLDALIDGGLKARQLNVIAGPTGAGKTGAALELARRLAPQLPVLYVSTELDV